jgi:hypothetical protein
MRTSCSRNFQQFILNKYPSITDNIPFKRFFHYLCFGDFSDRDTKQLVIPTRKMAEEFYRQEYSCHFNGREVLEEFRDKVLPNLSWSGHEALSGRSWNGKARQITCNGFDAEMQDALRQECLSPSEDQVEFITGEPYHREDRYRDRAQDAAAYEAELAGFSLNPTQTKILDYLRQINAGHLFIRKLHDNRADIEEAVKGLPVQVQVIQHPILANVHHNPTLYYLPSSQQRTCRISPKGDSLLGLKREVRKAATKGWWECDLRSSQFAILAAKLKAPISRAFVASGRSLWSELYAFVSGVRDAEPPGETKKVLKEAIYSLCYGKSKAHLKEFMALHGMVKLLKHPILAELLELRKRWFQEIERAGGAHDVWGEWHAVDEKQGRWAGSVAASIIQAVEMEIIAPIFDVAVKHGKGDRFHIVLFQHDGATLSFNDKTKMQRAQAKLKKAVEDRARELGVSTVLEFSEL